MAENINRLIRVHSYTHNDLKGILFHGIIWKKPLKNSSEALHVIRRVFDVSGIQNLM
jgi:hypothetical protein